jgi:hypothetical protein
MEPIEAYDRARSLYREMATALDRPDSTMTTLEFGSGGFAFLAGRPDEDLAAGREWLFEQRDRSGLLPLVVEGSEAFLDDYTEDQEGTVAEILATFRVLVMGQGGDAVKPGDRGQAVEWRAKSTSRRQASAAAADRRATGESQRPGNGDGTPGRCTIPEIGARDSWTVIGTATRDGRGVAPVGSHNLVRPGSGASLKGSTQWQ